ncbi:hypothetical protein ACQKTA_13410 (plasmid) [Enterococcus sp. 22-H-5-01]|uniref:hypothetical protein n=1 Tax=Enterococcus sp. 22-H-5-01 TaxID=3418555 RepID=UPI003D0440CF
MDNSNNTINQTYTLNEMIRNVQKQHNGLFRVPNSELTIADTRYFDSLDFKNEQAKNIVILSNLETEKDFLLVKNDEVIWRDNWSGEDDRIYRGDVLNKFKVAFDKETFLIHADGLKNEKMQQSIKAPTVQIHMNTNH